MEIKNEEYEIDYNTMTCEECSKTSEGRGYLLWCKCRKCQRFVSGTCRFI